MLVSIRSNNKSFKEVHFKPGMNVILAERTSSSSSRDSRNGIGKTSLINIIDFCLGSKGNADLFKAKELQNWTFTLDLEIDGKPYSITRSIENKSKVHVEGDCSNWLTQPKEGIMPVSKLIENLGYLLFGLKGYLDTKYTPTYRSCISYFIRTDKGSYLDPFSNHPKQSEWDKQVNNSFLLGIDWQVASEWQILKDRKKLIEQLKNEMSLDFLKDLGGTLGDLEAKKIRLEEQLKSQKKKLDTFEVHPQYKEIEVESNDLTTQIHQKSNSNVHNRKLLEHYHNSLLEEPTVDPSSVISVYKEAGVIFPDNVTKEVADVIAFHKQVIQNRQTFLNMEMTRLKEAISINEKEIESLSNKRGKLLSILQTHKALEEYTLLQERHSEMKGQLSEIENAVNRLKKFEEGQSSLKVDRELLLQKARARMEENQSAKASAIRTFNENSEVLYDSPGTLSIDLTSNGYKFNVDIEREGSHGINNMKIFCYDLMLAQVNSKKDQHPEVLIHDSIIFADVDERQVAEALQLAAKESLKKGFQYICTMNSDSIPRSDFNDGFDFDSHVVLTLNDKTEQGGLLGFRVKK